MKQQSNVNMNKTIKVITIMFIILVIAFGRGMYFQITKRNELNKKISLLQEQKNKLNQEIEIIKKDIKNKDTEEFIVKIAREKLKMVKKNEVVVKYKE